MYVLEILHLNLTVTQLQNGCLQANYLSNYTHILQPNINKKSAHSHFIPEFRGCYTKA